MVVEEFAGFSVSTPSGKRGVPDGFSFDGRRWYVVKCELLNDGIRPHVAEQMVRLVVATKNYSAWLMCSKRDAPVHRRRAEDDPMIQPNGES